ncbi:MAG: class II aldolase, partial [Pseudorhodobacter sp.]|nr:class II aldolase [Rhizobacter sp.]
MTVQELKIQSRFGKVSDAEWQTRVDLAAAYRLVAAFKWDDLVFTHI